MAKNTTVITIDQLKPEQLSDLEVFGKIEDLANPFILGTESREAFDLANRLNRLLEASAVERQAPELYKKYQNLIIKLKWAAMPFLSNEEAADLLKKNLLTALSNEYIDTENRIEAKMLLVPFLLRDELRQNLNRAIKENEEKLGPKTIGEWIIDYIRTYDIRKRTAMSHAEYVSKNPEAQTLSEAEKNNLRKILHLLDHYLVITPLVDYFQAQEIYKELIKEEGKEKPEISRILTEAAATAKAQKEKEKRIAETVTAETQKKERITEIAEEKKPKKLKKPGFFKRLFGSSSVYEKKISPYEKEREVPEKIPTFPKEAEKEIKKEEKREEKREIPKKSYQIRTMKQDIEKAKRQPIPPKPKPMPTGRQAKVKDNIVDLSGK